MKTELITRRFNGVAIPQRADSYLNATAMCKADGRRWEHYWANKGTQEFVAELARSTGIPVDVLVVSVTTGQNNQRGTWVHPQVAYHLAQWCSAAFAVQVTEWIHDIRAKGYAAAPGVEFNGRERLEALEKAVADLAHLARAIGEQADARLMDSLRALFPPAPIEPSLPPLGYLRFPDYLAAKGIVCLTGKQKSSLSRRVRTFCMRNGFKVEEGFGGAYRGGNAYPIYAMDRWWAEGGTALTMSLVRKQTANGVYATPLFSVGGK